MTLKRPSWTLGGGDKPPALPAFARKRILMRCRRAKSLPVQRIDSVNQPRKALQFISRARQEHLCLEKTKPNLPAWRFAAYLSPVITAACFVKGRPGSPGRCPRAFSVLMESKSRSICLLSRTSLSENRFPSRIGVRDRLFRRSALAWFQGQDFCARWW